MVQPDMSKTEKRTRSLKLDKSRKETQSSEKIHSHKLTGKNMQK